MAVALDSKVSHIRGGLVVGAGRDIAIRQGGEKGGEGGKDSGEEAPKPASSAARFSSRTPIRGASAEAPEAQEDRLHPALPHLRTAGAAGVAEAQRSCATEEEKKRKGQKKNS